MKVKSYNFSLGLTTNAKAYKGAGQKWNPRVTFHSLKSVGKCEGINLHIPNWAPTLEVGVSMDSQWNPKFSEGNNRGQNSLEWKVPYIIEIFLERKCLKWACMTHMGIQNISYGQKNSKESNCQFDPRPLKVGNRFDLLAWRWHATYCWKYFDESYNFVLGLTWIGDLHKKLWAFKIAKS
jgi:hypothetical protein